MKKNIVSVVVLVVSIAVASTLTFITKSNADELSYNQLLEQAKTELKEENDLEIKEKDSEIEALNNKIKEQQNTIDELNTNIANLTTAVNDTQENVSFTQDSLKNEVIDRQQATNEVQNSSDEGDERLQHQIDSIQENHEQLNDKSNNAQPTGNADENYENEENYTVDIYNHEN